MKKVKITVLKCTLMADIVAEYGNPGMGPCTKQQEGQIFYCDWNKPPEICDEAWKAIHHYVMALCFGGSDFFHGRWVNDPNIAIVSCNDGLRPVIYKLEAVDA